MTYKKKKKTTTVEEEVNIICQSEKKTVGRNLINQVINSLILEEREDTWRG